MARYSLSIIIRAKQALRTQNPTKVCILVGIWRYDHTNSPLQQLWIVSARGVIKTERQQCIAEAAAAEAAVPIV